MQTAGSVGGLLDCVVRCDGRLGIGRLLDDGLRDLGVRVTALVQRAACECSDAWRCCQLPANALALPLDILVVELRQDIHRLLPSTPLSLDARCLCRCIMQPMYMNVYRFLEEAIFWVEATRMLSEYIWAAGCIQGRLFDYGACDSAQVWCMRRYTRLVHAVFLA